MTHLIEIIELKGISETVMAILAKAISLVKTMFFEEKHFHGKEAGSFDKDIETITKDIIDLVWVLSNKHQEPELNLRIVQTAYSLI
jgi:hypothetical protein